MAESLPWQVEAEGLMLWLRLTPKGGIDALDGVDQLSDGRAVIKARVRAAPEDGRANAALIDLLARFLRVPKKLIVIRSGETSRLKKIFVAGDAAQFQNRLAELASDNG
ncbi:MAG: DUF167 domain-containing protein [Methylocystaceae bacterium]|nr:DUF167 domain-containing protein [Methylocystaceae bacterium]NBT97151.1 DUF167 domain-containing protein [Methylocystaceae bacterium]